MWKFRGGLIGVGCEVGCSESEFSESDVRIFFGVFGVGCSDSEFSGSDVRIRKFRRRMFGFRIRNFSESTSPTGQNLGLDAFGEISNSPTVRSLGLDATGRISTAQPAEA
ncbi:hypothetical protein OUZ56_012202 [Daphnia magna]|uniref:Uncharacterized protein n=1 Tax=Daphnia magna TaxID=35525 RepID=A0ABQ9Z2B8_9CRUS|nr:hypothetical protein OUZ56_012202 [Daphnia magna]